MNRNLITGIFVFLFFGLLNGMVEGAEYCVSSSLEIQNALTASAGSNEEDLIKIVQSTAGPYVGNFDYTSNNSGNLTIEGGYTTGCSSRIVNPGNTVLDAVGNGTVLRLNTSIAANFTVDGLTLQHGTSSGLIGSTPGGDFILSNSTIQYNSYGQGGGAKINARRIYLISNLIMFNIAGYGGGVDISGGDSETINFYNNFISQNITNSGEGGGVHIKYTNATVNFVNNVISKNATTLYIGGGHGGGAHISTYGGVNFINNTVVGNSANSVCCWGGGTTIYYAAYANVYNNVFWQNSGQTGRDIAFYSIYQSNLSLFYNNIDQSPGGISGLTPDFQIDPSNLDKRDPVFADINNEDYHLLLGSPCIDAGFNDAPMLSTITTDKDGQPRIANGMVDMGAYEWQGPYQPTSPDLYGKLREFHYYKFNERIVVDIDMKNRGIKSGQFKVAFYLSENGVSLGQLVDEDRVKEGLKSGKSKTSSCRYTSEASLSGKYIIAVIDSGGQISEMVETNNRVVIRIP